MHTTPSNKAADTKYWKGLVANHRAVLVNFIDTRTTFDRHQKNSILQIYDNEIDKDNIRYFYPRTMRLFLVALITGKLDQIKVYNSQPHSEEGSSELG